MGGTIFKGRHSYGKPILKEVMNDAYVGNFCSIAGNVNIYLGGNHIADWVTTYPFGHIHQNKFNIFNGVFD